AASGRRSFDFATIEDGQVVQLEPAGTIAVSVHGIPADLPREKLEVWVREEPREKLAGPRAVLGEGDVARVDLPARGRYVLWLLVTTRRSTGSSGAPIASSPE